jgi:hypothetical protein
MHAHTHAAHTHAHEHADTGTWRWATCTARARMSADVSQDGELPGAVPKPPSMLSKSCVRMASPETLLVANAAREHRIAPRKPLMRWGMDLFALLWRQSVIASIHRTFWRTLA